MPAQSIPRAGWLQWGLRWLWLVFLALGLAWQREAGGAALMAVVIYASVQLVVTVWLLVREDSREVLWFGVGLDTLLPAVIVGWKAASLNALWVALLAGPVSAGLLWGWWSGVAFVIGELGLVAVLFQWVSAGGSGQLVPAALLLVPAAGAAAWGARRLARWLVTLRGGPLPGAVRSEREGTEADGSFSLDHRQALRDQLLAGLAAGRETLAAGRPSEDLSGVGLLRGDGGLEVIAQIGARRSVVGRKMPGERGLLANVWRDEFSTSEAIREDEELSEIAATCGWRTAFGISLEGVGEGPGCILWGSPKQDAFRGLGPELMRALRQEAQMALRYARLRQELRAERDQLNEIQEEARKKLARDLHDGPTQVIAAIAMRTNFARRQMRRDQEAAARELATVEEMARSTTKEIRHMLFTLRPLILESRGLKSALNQFAHKVGQTHGQRVLVEAEAGVEAHVAREQEGPLFYIAEEAVNNACKHAAAETVWVRLRETTEEVILEIEDDGVGFNVGAVDAHYEQRGSLGMVTMRERAQLLGGSLEIKSEQGEGTVIRARVPATPSESPTAPLSSDGP